MPRELPFRPGECDSCLWFRPCGELWKQNRQNQTMPADVGRCTHPDGPLDAHTTRTQRQDRVLALTRHVSSGMTCARYVFLAATRGSLGKVIRALNKTERTRRKGAA